MREPDEDHMIPWHLPRAAAHTVDPATGIWPVREWGLECARGFVRDERFARPGDRVIAPTNRATTRAWRQSRLGE